MNLTAPERAELQRLLWVSIKESANVGSQQSIQNALHFISELKKEDQAELDKQMAERTKKNGFNDKIPPVNNAQKEVEHTPMQTVKNKTS